MYRSLLTFVLFAACAMPAFAGAGGGPGTTGIQNALQARAKPTCAKGDPVVWLNTRIMVFFPDTSPYYAHTYNGQFICQSDAIAKGARLTKYPTGTAPPGAALPTDAPASTASPVAAPPVAAPSASP